MPNGAWPLGADRVTPSQCTIKELHENVVAAHSDIKAGSTAVDVMAQRAALMLERLTRMLDAEAPVSEIHRAVHFFRAIRRLKINGIFSQHDGPIKHSLSEVEEHGKYLARKLELDYDLFLTKEDPVLEVMLEADAMLNACAILGQLMDRISKMDDEVRAASLIPAAVLTASRERTDASQPMLAAWAQEQLGGLTAIEPSLGVQLEREGNAFRLSRACPDSQPLYRCLTENRHVLEPLPLAIFSVSRSELCLEEFDVVALIGAAQTILGFENVLVMFLDGVVPDALNAVKPRVRIFAEENWRPYLSSRADLSQFVRDYLLAAQPRFVVNCGCSILWDIYRGFGRQFSAVSRLYALLSGFDKTERGVLTGFASSHLPETLPHLAAVYSNNAHFKRALSEMLSVPEAALGQVQLVYQPSPALISGSTSVMPSLSLSPPRRRRPCVGWADYPSGQARPELLADIARLCPDFDFAVYGSTNSRLAHTALIRPNILFMDKTHSPETLPWQTFDAFLYTSLWEGLPRLLLGAAASKVPIIAADLGGVTELVSSDRGWPIRDHTDPSSYSEGLKSAVLSGNDRVIRLDRMTNYVSRVHSSFAFLNRVQDLNIFGLRDSDDPDLSERVSPSSLQGGPD